MPDWKSHVRPRLSSLRLSPSREHEIVEELSQHLEDRWTELVAGGMPEDEADVWRSTNSGTRRCSRGIWHR